MKSNNGLQIIIRITVCVTMLSSLIGAFMLHSTPSHRESGSMLILVSVAAAVLWVLEEVVFHNHTRKYVAKLSTMISKTERDSLLNFPALPFANCERSPQKITDGTPAVSLEELLKTSDIVTLHCPLTKDNEKMINAESLGLMKKSAFFVNTARGGLVDEKALAQALENEVIAGAGIDVLTNEPMSENCPLRNAKNCTVTPHIAWAPKQTRERLLETVAQNLKMWIEGTPQNVVNGK